MHTPAHENMHRTYLPACLPPLCLLCLFLTSASAFLSISSRFLRWLVLSFSWMAALPCALLKAASRACLALDFMDAIRAASFALASLAWCFSFCFWAHSQSPA